MESESSQDGAQGAAPTPAEARDALSRLHADNASLADRIVTPWWYHVTLGLIVAVIICSQAMPNPASTAVLALSIVGILVLVIVYTRRYGVWINRPAGTRSRRLLLTLVVIVILSMSSNVVVKFTDISLWWTLVPAAVAFGATIILGRRYDAALRSEVGGTQVASDAERS